MSFILEYASNVLASFLEKGYLVIKYDLLVRMVYSLESVKHCSCLCCQRVQRSWQIILNSQGFIISHQKGAELNSLHFFEEKTTFIQLESLSALIKAKKKKTSQNVFFSFKAFSWDALIVLFLYSLIDIKYNGVETKFSFPF